MVTEKLGQLGQGVLPEAAAGKPAEPLAEPVSRPLGFTLTVPATSANLGPGYDSMGLALDLRDSIEVTASPRAEKSHPQVEIGITGFGADQLPTDASHLVISVVERILAARGFLLPDLTVQAVNHIPHSRGLGSSAAAIATAVMTAHVILKTCTEGLSPADQLQIGSRLEGHPDNYVPALRGGIAMSWQDATGDYATARLQPHPELTTVVALPSFTQPTQAARDLLPAQVPHHQAASNSARAALLTHALTTAPEFLMTATEDFLHQEYRRAVFGESMRLLDSLRQAGLAAVISGAGPAVLVLGLENQAARAEEHIASFNTATHQAAFEPRNLPIAQAGVTVEVHQR